MDDVFSILKRMYVEGFLRHLNSVDQQIFFTIEQEQDSHLPFLDVAVDRLETGYLRTSVFRKPTNTDQVLNYHSEHAVSAKTAVARALMTRVETHSGPDDEEGKEREKSHIVEVLEANGYPSRFIERVARKCETDESHTRPANSNWVSVPYMRGMSEAIANVLRPLDLRVAHRAAQWKWTLCSGIKDKVPEHLQKGVVYSVPCYDCNSVYIGETLRNLETRLQEHRRHTEKCDHQRSAVAEHSVFEDHRINWDGARVLDREQAWRPRKIKEALHIVRQGHQ